MPEAAYASAKTVEARCRPGVRYTVSRMSLGRRIELTKQVHELSRRIEFLDAGGKPHEQIEAAWLSNEIDRIYLRWGLVSVEGLMIDGEPATPEKAIEVGPEDLSREILEAIRAETSLTADERKN